ncbi:hypothetical protein ABKN59_007000 [Abortiporus biennis]
MATLPLDHRKQASSSSLNSRTTVSNALWGHLISTSLKDNNNTNQSKPTTSIAPVDRNATSTRILLHDTQHSLEKFSEKIQKLTDTVDDAKRQIQSVEKLFQQEHESVVESVVSTVDRCQLSIQKILGQPSQASKVDQLHREIGIVDRKVEALDRKLDALHMLNQTQAQALQSIQDQQTQLLLTLTPVLPLLQSLPLHIDNSKNDLKDAFTQVADNQKKMLQSISEAQTNYFKTVPKTRSVAAESQSRYNSIPRSPMTWNQYPTSPTMERLVKKRKRSVSVHEREHEYGPGPGQIGQQHQQVQVQMQLPVTPKNSLDLDPPSRRNSSSSYRVSSTRTRRKLASTHLNSGPPTTAAAAAALVETSAPTSVPMTASESRHILRSPLPTKTKTASSLSSSSNQTVSSPKSSNAAELSTALCPLTESSFPELQPHNSITVTKRFSSVVPSSTPSRSRALQQQSLQVIIPSTPNMTTKFHYEDSSNLDNGGIGCGFKTPLGPMSIKDRRAFELSVRRREGKRFIPLEDDDEEEEEDQDDDVVEIRREELELE